MYCGKCGTFMDEGAKFCPSCGAPAGEQYQANVPGGKPKTHKGLIAGVIAAAAVVVIGVGAVFAAPALKSTFMSPASYYRDVELNSIGNGLDVVEGIINELSSVGSGASGNMELEVADGLLNMIGYGVGDYIGDVDSAGMDFDFSNGSGTAGMDMTLRLEDTTICEFEMIFDNNSQKAYIGLPGLSDSYAEMDFDEMGISDVNPSALSSLKELPKGSDVSDAAKRVLKAAFKCIDNDNVEREKGKITVGSVTQSCTVYTVSLDGETLNEMAVAALVAARDDSGLKSAAYEFVRVVEDLTGESFGYSKSEFEDMMESSIDSAIDDVDVYSDFVLTYDVYVDSNGNVLGREFTEDGAALKMLTAQNGKNYAFEYSAAADGVTYVLSGDGTKSGDEFTGDVYLNVEGMNVLEMKMYDYEFDGKSMTSSGKMELSFGSASSYIFDSMGLDSSVETVLKTLVLVLDFDMDKNSSELELEVSAGGMKLGEITMNGKNSTSYSPSVPRNIYAGDVDDYMEDIDMTELANRLERAGIPSSVTNQLRYIY